MGRAVKAGEITGEILAIWGGIKGSLPFLEDEAIVTASIPPGGTRQSAYFLCCAVAFGMVKRYDNLQDVSPPPGMIAMEYDASTNEVTFTVRYRTCLATATNIAALKQLPLYNGPPETNYGGAWNFTGELIDITGVGATPALPNIKRPILSRSKIVFDPSPAGVVAGGQQFAPNPRPTGDGRSRASIYQLVYAALTTPQGAGRKQFPLPTPANIGIGG